MNALGAIDRGFLGVEFRELLIGDVLRIFVQPSQHFCLGVNRPVLKLEDATEIVTGGPAWTAIDQATGRVLAIAGFKDLWPANPPRTDGHAIAWAVLAADLGPAHLAISSFARAQIAAAPYSRLEAIVRMNLPAEYRWARLVGFGNPRVLRKWGPDGEPHMLLERVR
jgi:hypothetical protein